MIGSKLFNLKKQPSIIVLAQKEIVSLELEPEKNNEVTLTFPEEIVTELIGYSQDPEYAVVIEFLVVKRSDVSE